jgi:hypothetical protein
MARIPASSCFLQAYTLILRCDRYWPTADDLMYRYPDRVHGKN